MTKMNTNKANKKLYEAVFGLAIGDALGVPYEFMSRGSFQCKGMTGHGTHDQPAGTWSDDTSMTIATAKSIKDNNGRIDTDNIRANFLKWMKDEEFTATGELFDIGIATSGALRSGRPKTGESDNGNGALMRILPLAFTNATDDEIQEVSAITHGHEISMQACVIYVHVARRLMNGETIREIIPTLQYDAPFDRLYILDKLTEDDIRSGGYVVDTLEASLWALVHGHDFQDTILTAIDLGRDTDTTGAVTGGLAGIVYGLDSEFARNCMEQLRGKELIKTCLWKAKDPELSFHGEKCCSFAEKRSKSSIQYSLSLIKRYEGIGTSRYADHIYHSLWQCNTCGAFFLLEEVEQSNWSGGDDTFYDDYYQVESEEHADLLVSEHEGLFGVYEGPVMRW